MNLKDKLSQVKQWVIQQVIWAEKELKDKDGAERKAAVVRKIDDMLILPWWAEWADEYVIGYLVDLVCEQLNMFTGRDIAILEGSEEQTEKLLVVMDAPAGEITARGVAQPETKGETMSDIDERLNALYKKYGILPEPAAKEEAQQVKHAAPAQAPKNAPTPTPSPSVNSDFKRAIAFSLKWEGGRNFDIIGGIPVIKGKSVNDRGGLTAYGITNSTLKYAHVSGVVKHADIVKLTRGEAEEIYRRNFWDRYSWGELPWPVSLCCLDCSINHGGFAWILQRALNVMDCKVTIDGKYGPQTRNALIKTAKDKPLALAGAICECRKKYYEQIIARAPNQAVFRTGWFNRVADLRKACGL